MKLFIRKMFELSDLRYPWLLLASMLLFLLSLYNNKINPDITGAIEWMTYGTAIGCAFVWSVIIYVEHIRINSLYRKNDDISAYVDSLMMTKEEKEDLKTYLSDFVKDLKANGKSHQEAVKVAIAQFQVQEFTSLSKNSGILELPVHYYLFGYVLIFTAVIIVLQCLTITLFSGYFLLKAISFTLMLYSAAFIGLYLLYRLIDIILTRKMIR